MNRPIIKWNRPMLTRLKAAYGQAQQAGLGPDDVFTFEGNEFLVAYAGYLIKYLDYVLK